MTEIAAPCAWVGSIAMIGRYISHRVAVGDNIPLESPLTAQLILQQILIRARRLAIDRVIGAHHRSRLALHNSGAECRLVRIHLIVLAHVHIREVARRLRSAVHRIVFWRRDGEIVFGIMPCNPVT